MPFVTVITPAEHQRLTTVEAVRRECGISIEDLDNAGVTALIEEASSIVAEYCGRVFAREEVKETILGATARLVLSRYPVASVAEVTGRFGSVATDTLQIDAQSGIVVLPQHQNWRPQSDAQVRYTAGYVLPGEEGRTLPRSIERAAILLIGTTWNARERDPAVKSEMMDGVGRLDYFVPGAFTSLPSPEAEALLRTYRAPRMA
jgi:hypothetical protein